MPTRNRVRSLRNAVESVLSQTYHHIELIVVDDASTDGTGSYLAQQAVRDPRLVSLCNPVACGAPASRNRAIQQARGEFVTGLDDDDAFLPERISGFVDYWQVLESCEVHPACLYAQDIWLENGVRRAPTRKKGRVSADALLRYNYIGNQVFALKTHFIEAGLFDECLPAWQDLDLFIRMLRQFGDAHLWDVPTYLFDVTPRPDRISAQEKKLRAAFEILASKHAVDSSLRKKALFLQLFQDGYHISPTMADWLRVLQWGGFPRGLRRLLQASFRYAGPPMAVCDKAAPAPPLPMAPEGLNGRD
jgi:glycosyltransferase involved in cell wall biosynthesis